MVTERGKTVIRVGIIPLVVTGEDKTNDMLLGMGLIVLKITRKTGISRVGGPQPDSRNSAR